MIDLIVLVAMLAAAVFTVAWFFRPGLRAWIERPKYRFQANVRTYDQELRTKPKGGQHE